MFNLKISDISYQRFDMKHGQYNKSKYDVKKKKQNQKPC